ncbi:hypothetical protein EPUL_002523 [Erysiphe pulchra]|uniref:Uncharacterized protein n=1 Tax=Erysiphe pulchra TaxID=225359 RepID=A0A2S4Q006_9PEZI|nr:hypothetical protein EPUL_002523 [Erysiphe pulchra]
MTAPIAPTNITSGDHKILYASSKSAKIINAMKILYALKLQISMFLAINLTSPLIQILLTISVSSAKIKNAPNNNFKEIIPVSRLFVRLPLDHKWRNLSPVCLREVIFKHLAVFLASIGVIKPICTGFAISPRSSTAREALLRTNISLLDTSAQLKPTLIRFLF